MAKKNGAGPAREEIQLRAYEIYLRRGSGEGTELNDWLQAERELREQYNGTPGSAATLSKGRSTAAAAGRHRVR